MRMTDTDHLKLIIEDGWKKDRNRQASNWLMDNLDPEGWHIAAFTMPHNDVEWRTQFLCKVIDTDEPATVWLDYAFEYGDALVPVPRTLMKAKDRKFLNQFDIEHVASHRRRGYGVVRATERWGWRRGVRLRSPRPRRGLLRYLGSGEHGRRGCLPGVRCELRRWRGVERWRDRPTEPEPR